MIIGLIGLVILMIAFAILNTKWFKWFIALDFIATVLLIIHASVIKDWVFIITNSFIAIMLLLKYLRGGLK